VVDRGTCVDQQFAGLVRKFLDRQLLGLLVDGLDQDVQILSQRLDTGLVQTAEKLLDIADDLAGQASSLSDLLLEVAL